MIAAETMHRIFLNNDLKKYLYGPRPALPELPHDMKLSLGEDFYLVE